MELNAYGRVKEKPLRPTSGGTGLFPQDRRVWGGGGGHAKMAGATGAKYAARTFGGRTCSGLREKGGTRRLIVHKVERKGVLM